MRTKEPMAKPTGKGVELVQLVGKRNEDGTDVLVAQPVDIIYLDGEKVGTIGHLTGAKLCLRHHVSDENCEKIHKEVTKIRVKKGKYIPAQEGVKWKRPVDPDVVATKVPGSPSDEELLKAARSLYGLDDEEEIDIDPEPTKKKKATGKKK